MSRDYSAQLLHWDLGLLFLTPSESHCCQPTLCSGKIFQQGFNSVEGAILKQHPPYGQRRKRSQKVWGQSKPGISWVFYEASLVPPMVKNPPAMQETWVQSLGWEDPLEKEMAWEDPLEKEIVIYSSILIWEIPWRASVHGVTKNQNMTEQPTLSVSLEEPPRCSQLNLWSFPFLVLLLYSFTSTSLPNIFSPPDWYPSWNMSVGTEKDYFLTNVKHRFLLRAQLVFIIMIFCNNSHLPQKTYVFLCSFMSKVHCIVQWSSYALTSLETARNVSFYLPFVSWSNCELV